MAKFTVHQAKTHFSKLLKRVEAGEEIVIARGREVIAKLVPAEKTGGARIPGQEAGRICLADDFHLPLSAKELEDFEGEPA